MFETPTLHKNGQNYHASFGDDSQAYVEFRKEAIQSGFKSDQAGRPIFDDVDFIKIMFPGDKTKIVDRPVTDLDKQRFSRQWDQYEKTGQVSQVGTPIEQWPPLTKGQALTLKALGIFTVENLAAMSDHGLDAFLGARDLREQAKAYLDHANGTSAVVTQLTARLNQLELDNQSLKDQISALGGEKGDTEKRGRPRKDA